MTLRAAQYALDTCAWPTPTNTAFSAAYHTSDHHVLEVSKH